MFDAGDGKLSRGSRQAEADRESSFGPCLAQELEVSGVCLGRGVAHEGQFTTRDATCAASPRVLSLPPKPTSSHHDPPLQGLCPTGRNALETPDAVLAFAEDSVLVPEHRHLPDHVLATSVDTRPAGLALARVEFHEARAGQAIGEEWSHGSTTNSERRPATITFVKKTQSGLAVDAISDAAQRDGRDAQVGGDEVLGNSSNDLGMLAHQLFVTLARAVFDPG